MSQKHAIIKTKGKRFIKTKTDHVSELPDDILSSIISYFTVRDAANSGLLSSRWKHLCASLSKLEFDLDSMIQTHRDCNIIRTCSMDICRQYKDIFVRGVNQALQGYQGTRLVFFRVTFCLEQDSTYDIDQWVSFAIGMGVEHLSLQFSCRACFVYDERCDDRDLYTLRPELFVSGNFAKVQCLHLRSCILGPGIINQFSNLTTIELSDIPFGEHEVESIGSCCLSVESLSLIYCMLPSKLCIPISLQRLKLFCVYHCWGPEMIKLSATNLTSFDYNGNFLTKFSFSGSPNLKRFFFRVSGEIGVQYAFGQLAKDLPLVETLLVFSITNWGKFLPEDITTFSKVKVLDFFSPAQSKFDILKIFAILKACPLLEKLYLVIGLIFPEQGMQQLCIPDESIHKNLKDVHIGGFQFNPSYIDLVIYMLEYIVALERMILDPEVKFYVGTNVGTRLWVYFQRKTWDEGEREMVCSWLQDHSKSSMIIIK